MKKNLRLFSLLAVILIYSKLSAQTNDEMKAYMDYMTPGPGQQMMNKSVGTWTGMVSLFTKEGVPPTTSMVEETDEMIMGGRYLKETDKGSMWGMPFEGMGTTGYDNARKIYMNTWIDNMGTGISYMEGTMDSVNHLVKFQGVVTNAVTKKAEPITQIITFVDPNHYTMDMYVMKDGKQTKYMNIAYVRK